MNQEEKYKRSVEKRHWVGKKVQWLSLDSLYTGCICKVKFFKVLILMQCPSFCLELYQSRLALTGIIKCVFPF